MIGNLRSLKKDEFELVIHHSDMVTIKGYPEDLGVIKMDKKTAMRLSDMIREQMRDENYDED